MRTRTKAGLLVVMAALICLSLLTARRHARRDSRPRLGIRFIGCTNVIGANMARFVVTNMGPGTAASPVICEIEVQDPPSKSTKGARVPLRKLAPGQEETIEVFLPAAFAGRKPDGGVGVFLPPRSPGKWRVKCLYPQAGFRWASSEFIWKEKGQILRKYIPIKIVPNYFKQYPFDVIVTSDWIEP